MSVNNSKSSKMSSIEDVSSKESVSLKEFNKTAPFSFSAKNYKILLIGLGVNILGFLLMIGGATDDPTKFDASELFSNTRITIAPMLIVLGYIVIAVAIMKKPKAK
ncbi:MAG: DUF3098 domain-containing protein [Crocinitomicaceae bacterium]|nr:DUF3098 domain-containing protein [Crocinitomicaceae bacterium]MDG1776259.1 DUF3098 domain-containing protein [Crocinitomicaceae bacterium]